MKATCAREYLKFRSSKRHISTNTPNSSSLSSIWRNRMTKQSDTAQRCRLSGDSIRHQGSEYERDCGQYEYALTKSGGSRLERSCSSRRHRTMTFSSIALWIQMACLLALAVFASAHDFQLELEPSRSLFDADDGGDLMQQNQHTETPHVGDADATTRGILRFLAVEGYLFNRSLTEELKKFDPGLLSEADTVQVHFPSAFEPSAHWLFYRESSGLLQGVPLASQEGSYNLYILVRHGNSPSPSTTTLPCTVEVLTEEQAFELRQTAGDSPEVARLVDDAGCSHHEPVTAAAIVVQVDSAAMSENQRVECLQALAAYMDVSAAKVSMTAQLPKKDRAFLSGPGNVPANGRSASDPDGATTVISWPLGCSSDLNDAIPGLERLEIAAKDGTLARAIGYDVSEWKIVNRVHRFKKLRVKRQLADVQSLANADHRYPRAIRSSQDGARNLRSIPGLETEETIPTKRRGRKRVNLGLVRATPMPGMPVAASRIPPSLDRNIVPPSTPTIPRPHVPRKPEPVVDTNHAPMVLFGMADVDAVEGTYMEFRIPDDAVLDDEEKSTRNLKLQILDTDTNEAIPAKGSWPLFDAEAQLIFGVPTPDAPEEKEYVLYAEDSGGKFCTYRFTMRVKKEKPKPATHRFFFYFAETGDTVSMGRGDALFSSFARKLAVALAESENMPGHLTMLNTATAKGGEQRYVSWFDSSLNSKACEVAVQEGIRKEAILIAGEDATEGKNKPTKEFSAKFKPEFKLKLVKIDLIGSCKPVATTSTTTTTTAETIPTSPPTPPTFSSKAVETTTTSTTTTTTTTTTPATTISTTTKEPVGSMPMAMKPLPELGVQSGRILEFVLPVGTFKDDDPGTELKIAMVQPTPAWVGFEPATRTILAVPTIDDASGLQKFNSTHGVWKGGVTAEDKDGLVSPPLEVKIFIKLPSAAEKPANHLFQVKIKNYALKNFTAGDRLRMVRLIRDIYGDSNSDSIYVRPLLEGSVIFSWHNATLAYDDPCPYKDIGMLAQVLFDGGEARKEIEMRFQEKNFVLGNINVSKSGSCKKMEPKTAPEPVPTTEESQTTPSVVAASSKSTSILIIAVVVVCLVLLVVILVVKCRMGKTAREKKRLQKEKQQREEKAMAIASPENAASPRIKKGVPIIFQDEIAMESNGNAYASATTPLMESSSTPHRGNGDSRSPAVAVDDEHIREETPFNAHTSHHPMTPPTPILSDRPPPPYVTPH